VNFDNSGIDNGGQVGMELRDSEGNVRFRFFFIGGENTYRVVDSQGTRSTTVAWTDLGLQLVLSLGENNAYTFTTGSTELSGTLAAGQPIQWIQFFNGNAGETEVRDVYIGAMTHTVAVTGEESITTAASITRTGEGGLTDGLPDSWWSLHFPDAADWTASDDADGDGFTNAQEYALGTDPTDPGSRFEVTRISRDGDETTVEWSSVSGKKYRLYASPSLSEPDWQPVGSEQTAADNRTSETHVATTARFYKVHLVP
jgi:hypothetical protein